MIGCAHETFIKCTMSDLTDIIDEFQNDPREMAYAYLLTVAAKAIATMDAVTAAEEGSAVVSSISGPLAGLYQVSGARVVKRSRKGKTRRIALHIAVEEKGTFLFWTSMLGLRTKKFNLSTLHEITEMVDGQKSSRSGDVNIVRLRNAERCLDFVVDSGGDHSIFCNFFNDFRR